MPRSLSRCLALETLEDRATPAVFTVTNTLDDTDPGSLRRAILDANAAANVGGPDRIEFNITGAGIKTIAVVGAGLPDITEAVVIDGYTQPGASVNTLGASAGTDAVVLVELDGSGATSSSAIGLQVLASDCTVRGLSIGGFVGAGIVINGGDAVAVEGCFIGTDATGAVARPNGEGVRVRLGSDNVIGGTDTAARNVIAANSGGAGVSITGDDLNIVAGTKVQGNLIGTNAAGTQALGNFYGIFVAGAIDTLVGGTDPAARNVIAGSILDGIAGSNDIAGLVIRGNYIGTNVTGSAALGNGEGVQLAANSQGVVIGGPQLGAGNVISGNARNGITVSSSGSGAHTVQGNRIGTAADGVSPLGNGHNGVFIFGTDNNTIGGPNPGEANTIAHNVQNGILVMESGPAGGGDGNNLDPNVIFGSGAKGIELGAGANRDQAAPVLSSAVVEGGTTTAKGTLQSVPNSTFRVEFFANSKLNASGNAEGEKFLGFATVTTDAGGFAAFSITFGGSFLGQFLTANATSPTNDTSEFSAPVKATLPAPPLAPPVFTGAVVLGTLLLLDGASGLQAVPVPLGTAAVMADVSGDGVADVILFTPGLVVAVNGQTGGLFALAADLNGDRFTDLQVFNPDGTSTFTDGRTGIVVTV